MSQIDDMIIDMKYIFHILNKTARLWSGKIGEHAQKCFHSRNVLVSKSIACTWVIGASRNCFVNDVAGECCALFQSW